MNKQTADIAATTEPAEAPARTPFGLADRNKPAAEYTGQPDHALEAEETIIRSAAASLLDGHNRAALLYSGGAESGLLLHLLAPFRQRLTVLWVNPGALPHEAEHVRRQAAGGPFVELPSDRPGIWAKHGLPSFLVPVDRMTAFETDTPMAGPPILPASSCCVMVRNDPGRSWCIQHGVSLLIHGQRRGEGSGMFSPGLFPHHWAALARWTRQEVMRRVEHHGVPLPMQYAQGAPESFECAVCPANLDAGRLAFLKQHYPAEHAETLKLAREVHGHVTRSYRAAARELEAAGE